MNRIVFFSFVAGMMTAAPAVWAAAPGGGAPVTTLHLSEDLEQVVVEINGIGDTALEEKAQAPKRDGRVRERREANGMRVVERFDAKDRRVEKALYDRAGRLAEFWAFDAATDGRIEYYEKYNYDSEKRKRIATWFYHPDGGFLKINIIYNEAGDVLNVFLEQRNAAGIKFREEWYTASHELVARKTWNPVSGAFTGHLLVKSDPDGQKRLQWLDERGRPLREAQVDEAGRTVESEENYRDRFQDMRRRHAWIHRPGVYF